MKKLISLLLAALFILSGCSSAVENLSDTEPSTDENSDTSTPPQQIIQDPTDVVISLGKPYKAAKPAAPEYPDAYNSQLTDGIINNDSVSYSDSTLVGFAGPAQNITIDLEKEYDTIHTFSANFLLYDGAGVSTNIDFTVFISTDNKKWNKLGKLTNEKPTVNAMNTATLKLDSYVTARYVRFQSGGNNGWQFMQELSVTAFTVPELKYDYNAALTNAYNKLGTVTPPQSGTPVNFSYEKTNISANCLYFYSGYPSTSYPDKGKMLTDKVAAGNLGAEGWVGFNGGKDASVTIDLGKTVTDIATVDIMAYNNPVKGFALPAAITVTALDEKKNATPIGVIYGNPKADIGGYTLSLPVSNTFSARYVKVTFHTVKDAIHLIEEITVSAYRHPNENLLYPPVKIDTNSTPWETPTDEYTNLILNKPHQIHVETGIKDKFAENNSPIDLNVMTDGEFSPDHDIHNEKYYKFYTNGERRHIIYDLTHISAVDKFTASFTNVTGWSVNVPKAVSIIVSVNGKEWYKAGEIIPAESNIPQKADGELVLPQKLTARYVVFAFDVTSWVGIDELQVFGTQSLTNAKAPTEGLVTEGILPNQRIEPSADLMGGATDLCLIYHHYGYSSNTVDYFKPYLAYLDKDGTPTDIMFDSFLFLYAVSSMPSGGSPDGGSVMSDWQWCIDDIFAKNQNLDALEKAAGEIKTALGLPEDFTYKVCLTLYNPTTQITDFGDIDGDGISENFTNYQDRLKAIQWYIDQCEKRYSDANFKNIELVGYYWWDEYVRYEDPDGEKLIKDTADMVHETDKDFIWIPWFVAPGYNRWESLGFDVACMQPNYVFKTTAPYSNLPNCEMYTKMYGMGVEMEVWEGSLSDKEFYSRYMSYIALGAEKGYMNDTICMYYQSMNVFGAAAISDNLMGRNVYDATYHFIKGDIEDKPQKLPDVSFTAKSNQIFIGKIDLPQGKLCKIKLNSQPDNAYVIADEEGNLFLFPQKDFKGEIKFGIAYSEYLNWSEETIITVTVE